MATPLALQIGSPLIYRNALVKTIQPSHQPFTCITVAKTTPCDEPPVVVRRSANYKPSLWDHRHLLAVENKYAKGKSVGERDLLKENVRKMLNDNKKPYLQQLQLIDDLHKLGVSYHFQHEIDNILTVSYQKDRVNVEKDLYATALEFQLFRQHGFNVSEGGTPKDDTDFGICDVGEMVVQALDMPYYWRMRRLATRWYIDVYGKKHNNKNLSLVEFAKIDFNIVQAVHQEDLKYVSSWWRESGLGDQLHFVRDRIVENYFWTVGLIPEPQYGNVRRVMTKINALITTVDDIYDVYGTFEELQLFTSVVETWDVNRLDELPKYMRLCFLVLYNEVNGIGREILKNQNINVIPFLKKSWTYICSAYLVEAKWFKEGHKPNVEEYMQNAWISISAPLIFLHVYCVFSDQISLKVLESLSQHQQNIARCSATVLRLANDLATSSDEIARGDVHKSIQCYMNETGALEEKARSFIRQMINDMWDEMNYEKMGNSTSLLCLPRDFLEIIMNLARMSQCIYQYGDGHGSPEKAKLVDRITSLLFNHIPLS